MNFSFLKSLGFLVLLTTQLFCMDNAKKVMCLVPKAEAQQPTLTQNQKQKLRKTLLTILPRDLINLVFQYTKVWNPQCCATFKLPDLTPRHVVALSDTCFVTASAYYIHLWDLSKSTLPIKHYNNKHKEKIHVLRTLDADHFLTASSQEKLVLLWHKDKEEPEKAFVLPNGLYLTDLAVVNPNRFVTTSAHYWVTLWDKNQAFPVKEQEENYTCTTKIGILDETNFITGQCTDDPMELHQWDEPSYQTNCRFCPMDFITSIQVFNPNLFISTAQKRTTLWDKNNINEPVLHFYEHTKLIGCCAIAGKNHFLTGSRDCTVKRWHKDKEQSRITFTGHTDVVTGVAVLNHASFVTVSADGTIKLWTKNRPSKLERLLCERM